MILARLCGATPHCLEVCGPEDPLYPMVAPITATFQERMGETSSMMIRIDSMKEQPDPMRLEPPSWRTSKQVRHLTLILLGPVLPLLLLSHGFGADWRIPSGLRPQMWSKVDYDPTLTDPFFESDTRSYPHWIHKHPDGSTNRIDNNSLKEPPRLKHTAKCFSTSFGVRHLVKSCEARLLEADMIDLLITHHSPAFDDALRVRIRNGKFTCQYWNIRAVGVCTWTTKRQNLTLDKQVYRNGDMIKGRIDFECVGEFVDPYNLNRFGRNPRIIEVYGVFKTILK